MEEHYMKQKKFTAILIVITLVLTTLMPMTAMASTSIPVTSIELSGITVPTVATVDVPLVFPSVPNANILPLNATERNVIWVVTNPGTTGATFTFLNGVYSFNATAAGTAEVRARIIGGAGTAPGGGDHDSAPVTVTVNAVHVPATGITITGLPITMTAGTPITLEGTVAPANANIRIITWGITDASTTGANIQGNQLSATSAGTIQMVARVMNGSTVEHELPFSVQVNAGATNITSVSLSLLPPATHEDVIREITLPSGSNFTASAVTWTTASGNNNTATFSGATFQGSTIYTASVTLTPNSGFAFAATGFTATIGGAAATITNRNDTTGAITISRTFAATRAPSSLPTTPLNLKAEPGNQQVVLTWDAPTNNGGSNILRYQISYGDSTGYTRNWIDIPHSNANTGTFTVLGLINGTDYSFQIRAVNQHGGGVATTPIRSTPIGTVTVPLNFRVSPGNGSVMLSWTTPAFTGGVITRYEYSFGPAGSYIENWIAIPFSGPGTTNFTLNTINSTLTNGVTYRFQVRAVNANGEGVATATLDATPDTNVLSPPLNLTAVPEDGQLTISWTAPLNNGGSAITKYQFSCITTAGNPTWRDVPDSGAGTTSHVITGLTNGTTYFIEVRAVNAGGDGSTSGVIIAVPATNATTSVDDRAADIQAAANNNTGQTITINMASGSNSISKAVLDTMAGKNVNLALDYGINGRITINGSAVNATNGAATLNLNLQRISGTASMLADYAIPKADIDARSPLPVHQLKIGAGASVAIAGTVTVNMDSANSGKNAILCTFNTVTKKFEVVSSAVIEANGLATVNFTATGDYLIIVQQDGDVTGTGRVSTNDALEILRVVAGLSTFDDIQLYVASTRRDGTIVTGDAMNILRHVAGLPLT
jgi:titin